MATIIKEYASQTQEYIAMCYEGNPPLEEVRACLNALEAVSKALF